MKDHLESSHLVQFYDDDQVLTSSVASFLADGLASGNAAIMIATPEHRSACAAALASSGLDVSELGEAGRLWMLDARETLGSFMSEGRPDEVRFREAVGRLIADASHGTGFRPVSAYGEMVNLLWRDGNATAAIQLEEMWNRLAEAQPLSLLCAYAMDVFHHHTHASGFEEVCRQHDRVDVAHAAPSSSNSSNDPFQDLSGQTGTALEGLHLLVVDDDDDARELLESMLGHFGAHVTTVSSMFAALEALKEESFDLLLSDLAMPRQDGYALIEAIRRDSRPAVRHIPAIAVTGHAADAYRDRALASGFDAYVTKPVDATRLLSQIQKLMHRPDESHH